MTLTSPDVRARDRIIEAVCAHYRTTLHEMYQPTRGGKIAPYRLREPRMMFAVLMRMHTRYSYQEIAAIVNRRHHSPILTSVVTFGQKPEHEQARLLAPFAGLEAVR